MFIFCWFLMLFDFRLLIMLSTLNTQAGQELDMSMKACTQVITIALFLALIFRSLKPPLDMGLLK